MAPIVNRPALYHILRLLQRHGISEVVINLHHLPEAITELLRRRRWLGHGHHATPSSPSCSARPAGSRTTQDFLGDGTFLVMSGDALTDIDLTDWWPPIAATGAIATLAVKEVADPVSYGVVVTDDDDRVVGFQEKPTREEARSHLCNCGIYVFEPAIFARIPAGQFDDFGNQVFPDLLARRHPLPRAHASRSTGATWAI